MFRVNFLITQMCTYCGNMPYQLCSNNSYIVKYKKIDSTILISDVFDPISKTKNWWHEWIESCSDVIFAKGKSLAVSDGTRVKNLTSSAAAPLVLNRN